VAPILVAAVLPWRETNAAARKALGTSFNKALLADGPWKRLKLRVLLQSDMVVIARRGGR
jgi:hypothetical protein